MLNVSHFCLHSTVQDVRTKAQLAFGKKHLRLITAKNRVLVDFEQTLEEAEIEDGECLTALVLQPQLAATRSAFALWCHGDSTIVTWGNAGCGGDSSAKCKIRSRVCSRFRPLILPLLPFWKMDLSLPGVMQHCGGDSSAVRDQLKGVQQIQATVTAFAAILEDGSVVTWGDARTMVVTVRQFEISSRVCSRFRPHDRAFAAILEDGSVVTWGEPHYGGDSSAVRDQLKGVQQIHATYRAFAAILEDGSVVILGSCRLWW